MTKAFCPGHITCFFSPVRTADVMTTGSLGAGIRLNKGTVVTAEERGDRKITITMDGIECDANVTERTIKMLAPDTGFDVTIENELPVSQGMGMSAAGAVAAGLCVASTKGMNEYDAYKAAHISEVRNGGGLGDVAGILGGRCPMRIKAGIPPFGRTIDLGADIDVSVVILGPKMDTGSVISDENKMKMISAAGAECVSELMNDMSVKRLYELSSGFSDTIGLMTKDVEHALSLLRKDHMASMCMLGNSIFTNADKEHVRNVLGDVTVISCSAGSKGPEITRKA